MAWVGSESLQKPEIRISAGPYYVHNNMKLCKNRPCGIYWRGSLISNTWNDHFHDGSTDVHLYKVIDSIVMLRNYPATLQDLMKEEGKIETARYCWYSCDISDNPDPRKRYGLEFLIARKIGDGYGGCRWVMYDNIVCKNIITYIRDLLEIKNKNVKAAIDKKVLMYIDEKKGRNLIVGVNYN